MTALEHAERLWESLVKLGPRRLTILGVIGVSVFAVTALAGYLLSRPTQEVLYAGLDRQDVSRIGSALREANLNFDVSADGATLYVRAGQGAEARMLLAEKGLPQSPNAGYELFDKLGSLGLTSFMQEVTRVRALEGELARTIQTMTGVKAARVHIVLPDEGSFRRTPQKPSASVVIRTESVDDNHTAQAIRHLVSASIPGMTVDEVTVLSTDGTLLATGGDLADGAPAKLLGLEKTVSQEIQDNIRKTLTPYVGMKNFQISVAARLNTDSKQTAETIYNPDSRVERSVRVVKENQTSQNSSAQPPTTVAQNVPQAQTQPSNNNQSNEDNQKREETTNYELSSKTVTTVSGGYSIENLSIAVLVNRASLIASLGDKPTPEAIDKRLDDIEQLVSSAAGFHKDRGDSIKVSAVDFVETGHDLEPVPPPSIFEIMMRQSGTVINALTILGVALLLIWFGLRPVTKAILAQSTEVAAATASGGVDDMLSGGGSQFAGDLSSLGLTGPGGESGMPMPGMISGADMIGDLQPGMGLPMGPQMGVPGQSWDEVNLIEDLTSKPRRSSQRRLEQMIEFDEEQAAAILKQWVHEGVRA